MDEEEKSNQEQERDLLSIPGYKSYQPVEPESAITVTSESVELNSIGTLVNLQDSASLSTSQLPEVKLAPRVMAGHRAESPISQRNNSKQVRMVLAFGISIVVILVGMALERMSTNALKVGQRLIDQHDYRAAMPSLDKAVLLNPFSSSALIARGRARGNLRLYQEDIDDCTRALTIDPKCASAFGNRGWANAALGRYQQAIDDCSNSINLDPSVAKNYQNRSFAYMALDKHQSALDDLNKALTLDPNLELASVNRAIAYDNLGRFSEALEECDRAERLYPNEALVYFARGYAYTNLGKNDKAIENCTKSLSLNPNLPLTYAVRALAYANSGQANAAMEDCAKASSGKSFLVNFTCGNAYNRLGQYSKAIASYNRAIALHSNYGPVYANRAKAYEKSGYEDLAQQDRVKAAIYSGSARTH